MKKLWGIINMKNFTYTEKKDTRSGFGDGLTELGLKNEAVRFMLEGRKNRSIDGDELAYKGLRKVGLVEHADDLYTGKKGRPTYRYRITQLGLQTLSNLNLQI